MIGNVQVSNFQSYVYTVTVSADTVAYASGDLLANTQGITLFGHTPKDTVRGRIADIKVIDGDDQKPQMVVVFLNGDISLGTENAAPNISDANMATYYLGQQSIVTADYEDFGGVSCANVKLTQPITFNLTGNTLYFAILSKGTPTLTAAGLTLKFGILLEATT